MTKKNYYDLDGTLSFLNNTFDFIISYNKLNKNYIRLFLFNNIQKIFYLIKLPVFERKIGIFILFFFQDSNNLKSFYENNYKPIFFKNLTKQGKEVFYNKKKCDVLLTGCTEMPAKYIAKDLNIKKVIAADFSYFNNKVLFIKKDSFRNLKFNFIKKNNGSYYTDDIIFENEAFNKFKEVYLIKKNGEEIKVK